jgi:hypothetical protein
MKNLKVSLKTSLLPLLAAAAVLFAAFFAVSCDEGFNMGGLGLGNDLIGGIRDDLSSNCTVINADDGQQCTVKLPIGRSYNTDTLISFFKVNRILSSLKPGYYPLTWTFEGFVHPEIPEKHHHTEANYFDSSNGFINLTVPPYDFMLKVSGWQERTDVMFSVLFVFEKADGSGAYEELEGHGRFPLEGGNGAALDDAYALSVYEANANAGDISPGFEYAGIDPSSDTQIKADGSSVFIIRLKRKTVEICFYTSESGTETDCECISGSYGADFSSGNAPKLTAENRYFITGWKDDEGNAVVIPQSFPEQSMKLFVDSHCYHNIYLKPSVSASGTGLDPSSPFKSNVDISAFISEAFKGGSGVPLTVYCLETLTSSTLIGALQTAVPTNSTFCRYVGEGQTASFVILSPDSSVTLSNFNFDGGADFGTNPPAEYAASNKGVKSTAPLVELNKSGIRLTLENCRLEHNHNTSSSVPGGAISCSAGSLELLNCVITQNCGVKGGGVYLSNTNLTSKDNTEYSANAASSGGGGVYFDYVSGSSAWAVFNTGSVTCNWTSGSGGGIYCAAAEDDFSLTGVKVDVNSSETGGGIYVAAGRFITCDNTDINGNYNTGGYATGVYVSGTLKVKNAFKVDSVILGAENAGIRFIDTVTGTAASCALTATDGHVDKQILKWYVDGEPQTTVNETYINFFTLSDSELYINESGYLNKYSAGGFTPKVKELTLGELDKTVISQGTSGDKLTFTVSTDAAAYVNWDSGITCTLYNSSSAEITDPFSVTVVTDDKIITLSNFSSALDIGSYTLVIKAESNDGSVIISAYSAVITVNY